MEDTLILKSIQSEYTHQEPVASLSWISSSFTELTDRDNQYNVNKNIYLDIFFKKFLLNYTYMYYIN